MLAARILIFASLVPAGCGGASPASSPSTHGTISSLSAARSDDATFCDHRVPADVCTRHNPGLVAEFKKVGDWCPEHGVPESQCFECHPDLSFEPLPVVPAGADLSRLSVRGEDVPSLEAHAVAGKVTVFDFYADWCAPCRKIDAHVFALLQKRADLAVRKLNVVSWNSPLAKRYLARVDKLPYVVVYGRDGKLVRGITGLDLEALDRAIAEGGAR
jgi:thiol-disulfide isomerase/thioredoxin